MHEVSELPKSETQIAEDRMASVERQIHAHLPPGIRRSIRCPYCLALNVHDQGVLFCCDLLRKAVLAVLMADRALKTAEAGERLLNGN